jgi:predicted nucleic acid-binding Zn finger protein
MDSREERGRVLAQDPRIKRVDATLWFVPSSAKEGGYLVNVETGRCPCPDHVEQKTKCKHIHAVELVRDGQAHRWR